MGRDKNYRGYRSFQYLEEGIDYPAVPLATEIDRVPPYQLPLSDAEEEEWHGVTFCCWKSPMSLQRTISSARHTEVSRYSPNT